MKFTAAIAASILLSSTLAETSFTPPVANQHSFNLTAAKERAKAKFDFFDEETPFNRYYFSNNTLIGDRLGKTNGTTAVQANYAKHMSLMEQGLITPEDVSGLDLIGYTIAGAIVSALLCAVVPGCPGYVATNLGPAKDLAIELITAIRGSRKHRRDDNQYENWACVYENGYDGTCTNGNVVNPIVSQIGTTDMNDNYGESYWKSVDPSDGTEFGHYWHCEAENADCSLGDMGGPTGVEDEGSTDGH